VALPRDRNEIARPSHSALFSIRDDAMPYEGDLGRLQFQRTEDLLGQPPPEANVVRDEFSLLMKTEPRKLVQDAATFLMSFGVVGPKCDLGDEPALIILGEPRLVKRGTDMLVVSDVLNEEIGWGRVTSVPAEGDNRLFTNDSTEKGFYSNEGGKQLYVHKHEEGQDFYDNLCASTLNFGILFNGHMKGCGSAPYHEILHTFEGTKLSLPVVLKEGFVERFCNQFMEQVYGHREPIYSGYADYVRETDKLLKYAGWGTCAKAYFGDDENSIVELVPCCYEPIWKLLKASRKLDIGCRMKMAGLSAISTYLNPSKMKAQGSWYRKWIANKNGGNIPAGGLDLPKGPQTRINLPQGGGLPPAGGKSSPAPLGAGLPPQPDLVGI
jgi:hypothetical protein